MLPRAAGWAAVATLVLGNPSQAQLAPLRGHVKAQQQYLAADAGSLADSLGYRTAEATSLDLRLIGSFAAGSLGFDVDYLLQGVSGSAVELQSALEQLEPSLFIDRADFQWLPLDDQIVDREDARVTQSFDRFALSFTTERWVFKLGRQAYTWGNGIVFRPFDILDPFAPDVLDDSYKPGVDAIYGQRLFADGSDVVGLVVPRRDPATGALSHDVSSAAIKWHRFGADLQTDVLVARDYLDTVIGLGASGSIGEAVWRLDLVPVRLDSGGARTSFVVNFEHAWQWRGRNVSGFVEYFRNGFGQSQRDYALDELDPALVTRLARGQVFNTGRDYLASGFRLELTPLLEVDPILLVNVGDRSALALLRGSYSVAQNLSLDFGYRVGIGSRGTEFGGLRVAADASEFAAPQQRVYARLAYYF